MGPYKCPTSLTSGIHSVIVVRRALLSRRRLLFFFYFFCRAVLSRRVLFAAAPVGAAAAGRKKHAYIQSFFGVVAQDTSRRVTRHTTITLPPLLAGATHVHRSGRRLRVQLQLAAAQGEEHRVQRTHVGAGRAGVSPDAPRRVCQHMRHRPAHFSLMTGGDEGGWRSFLLLIFIIAV